MLFHAALKLFLPVVSFVWMFLHIIKHALLTSIEAHLANVCSIFGKTIAIPASSPALNF